MSNGWDVGSKCCCFGPRPGPTGHFSYEQKNLKHAFLHFSPFRFASSEIIGSNLVTDRQTNSLTPCTGICGFFISVKFATSLLASLAGGLSPLPVFEPRSIPTRSFQANALPSELSRLDSANVMSINHVVPKEMKRCSLRGKKTLIQTWQKPWGVYFYFLKPWKLTVEKFPVLGTYLPTPKPLTQVQSSLIIYLQTCTVAGAKSTPSYSSDLHFSVLH